MPCRLKFNLSFCSGCMSCVYACASIRSPASDPKASALIYTLSPFEGDHSIHACRQCENAACQNACPVQAIRWNDDAAAWIVNPEVCMRCQSCFKACPFQAMVWHDRLGPIKCDLCHGDPECVKACHFDVIERTG